MEYKEREYTDEDRNEDFNYFLSIYDDLYKQYGHKHFAIRYKKILGIYDDLIEGINNTCKEYPLGTFIVQECTGDIWGYTSTSGFIMGVND